MLCLHTGRFFTCKLLFVFIVSYKLKDLHKITAYDEYLIQENTGVYPNWKVSSPIRLGWAVHKCKSVKKNFKID